MLPPEIEDCLLEFDRSLNITIPLKHHWDYIDAKRVNCGIQTEKDKAIQKFRQVADKKDGEEKRFFFAEKFHSEVDKLANGLQKKNEDFMNQSQSLLKKRREDLCADFKSSTGTKLLRNQDLDFEATIELVESGKELAKSYFGYHSNYGNPGSYSDERMKQEELLMQELNTIGKNLLKQRRRNQKSVLDEEGRKLLEVKAHSSLKKCVEVMCADFKSTAETKLLIAPDMDLKSLKELIETGKELAKNYFDYHFNFGKVGKHNEDILEEQELKTLGNGILEEQRRHLKNISIEEGKGLLENFKEHILEMSEKVKADSRQWNITKRKLKEKVQEIHSYMVENGSSILSRGSNREIYTELLKLEAEEEMTAEEFIEWTEGLSKEVKHDIECEMETPELHFLESDSDEDAPQVEVNSELESNQVEVKEEVLEMEVESSVLETCQEMDIDVKLELDELVLQTSSLRPDHVIMRSRIQNLEEKNGSCYVGEHVWIPKQQKLDETQSKASERLPAAEYVECISTSEDWKTGRNVTNTQIVNCAAQSQIRLMKQVGIEDEVQASTSSVNQDIEELQTEDAVPNMNYSVNPLNVPDEDGDYPLLIAISNGESDETIQKMLDDGADVNIKSDDEFKDTAAHEVIVALINHESNTERALNTLILLVKYGFTLINEKNNAGVTPLFCAMMFKNLDENLLQWFFENGANFNDVEHDNGDSVLMHAIFLRQSAENLRKILAFGGNPRLVNKHKQNVLHRSAMYAYDSALEMFIDQVEVNEVDEDHCTPLHYLFTEKNLDYHQCLKILLEKGADFFVRNNRGHVPMVNWMKFGERNPFPVLLKMKHILPITIEIASATLTAIVEEMQVQESLQKYLPSSTKDAQNEFAQFIAYLIEDKKVKLHLKDESQWKVQDWRNLGRIFWTRNFLEKLRTIGRVTWKGDLLEIKSLVLGQLRFCTKHDSVSVAIETVLMCLLACNNYKGLVKACEVVGKFCEIVRNE